MSEELDREEIRRRVRTRGGRPDVPGPTDNPATNLLLADVVMRMGSRLLRGGVERAFLKGRYGKETAASIVGGRSWTRSLGAVAIARFATRSVPGALIVGTGLLGKLLYEQSKSRRAARADGDATLLEAAAEDSGTSDT